MRGYGGDWCHCIGTIRNAEISKSQGIPRVLRTSRGEFPGFGHALESARLVHFYLNR